MGSDRGLWSALTMTGMVELGRRIEALEKPAAKERQAETLEQNKPADRPGNLPERSKGDTLNKVAAALGTSGRNYEKAKQVVEAAEALPMPL